MTIETVRQLMRDNPPNPASGCSQAVRDAVARYVDRRREGGETWSALEAYPLHEPICRGSGSPLSCRR